MTLSTTTDLWGKLIPYGYFVYEPFDRYQDSALGILHKNLGGQFGPTLDFLVTRGNPGIFGWLTCRDKLRPATLEDFDKYRLMVPSDYPDYALAPVPTDPAQDKAIVQTLADHMGTQPTEVSVSAAVYNQGHWFTLAGENTVLVGTIVESSADYYETLIWNPDQPEVFLQNFDRVLANCQTFAQG